MPFQGSKYFKIAFADQVPDALKGVALRQGTGEKRNRREEYARGGKSCTPFLKFLDPLRNCVWYFEQRHCQ